MTRLKSFTILEALISLIVMGIIIALTYSFMTLIGKQLYLFEKENTQVLEYHLFNTTLLNDINGSIDFNFQDNKLKLIYYDDSEIIYTIQPSYILRQNKRTITDTLNIKNVGYSNLKNSLQLKVILLGDTIQTNYFFKKNLAQTINQNIFHED